FTREPLKVPVWNSERKAASVSIWYARSWYGIRPGEKIFLIWGHAHLFGSRLKKLERRAKDYLLGYYRHSAYDLSENSMTLAAEELLRLKPTCVVGYSVALDRFARINADRRREFHSLRLKAVVATAESFPSQDSAGILQDVLGCPVAMEYGSVETGPLAHQDPSGGYRVFWRNYHLEFVESAAAPGNQEVLVTSLFPRCLPLIRYRTNDLVYADQRNERFPLEFTTVVGRCNDYVLSSEGKPLHSELFAHAVRDLSAIQAFQVIQSQNGSLTLCYTGEQSISERELAKLRQRLDNVSVGLGQLKVRKVESLQCTVAGKLKRIVRES